MGISKKSVELPAIENQQKLHDVHEESFIFIYINLVYVGIRIK